MWGTGQNYKDVFTTDTQSSILKVDRSRTNKQVERITNPPLSSPRSDPQCSSDAVVAVAGNYDCDLLGINGGSVLCRASCWTVQSKIQSSDTINNGGSTREISETTLPSLAGESTQFLTTVLLWGAVVEGRADSSHWPAGDPLVLLHRQTRP